MGRNKCKFNLNFILRFTCFVNGKKIVKLPLSHTNNANTIKQSQFPKLNYAVFSAYLAHTSNLAQIPN